MNIPLPDQYPTVDEYFQEFLWLVSRWTTVRYLLFTEFLADRSELFFFEDLLIDPVDWYGRFFRLVGLHLPYEVVFDLARTASGEGEMFGVTRKGIDQHPGSVAATNRTSFKDELNEQSLAMMDDVLRALLPPVLLKRLGVELP